RRVAALVGDGCEQPKLRQHRLLSSVHQHEAAGAVRILGFSWFEARLPDKRCLLVPERAGQAYIFDGRKRSLSIHFAAGNYPGQNLFGNCKIIQNFIVPLQSCQIHQLSAAGIGYISDVGPALRSAGKIPDQETIDCAEKQFAGFSLLSCIRNLIQYPSDLQSTEVSRKRKPSLCAIAILSSASCEFGNAFRDTRVLPDNCVANRFTTLSVPCNRSLALIGDPD